MKFIRNSNPKGIHIPIAALKISGISVDERVELHTLDNTLVLLKGRMTAPELLDVVHQLSDLAMDLLVHLANVCGPCEDCANADSGGCPYDELDDKPIDLPDYLHQEAGIPDGAKLWAETDRKGHSVTISAAEYRYDLSDVPPELLDTFAHAGACLAELEQHMILEDVVYGN